MNNFISATAAATKWCVSARRIHQYCEGGRIAGAKKFGNCWMIPADAEKPGDPRKAKKLQPQNATEYLPHGLLSAVIPMPRRAPDAVIGTLPNEQQKRQYAAEIAYMRGEFDTVKEYFKTVTVKDETYMCAANITAAAAMSTGDYALFNQISQTVNELSNSTVSQNSRCAAAVFPAFAAVCMNAPEMAPEWLKNGDFSDFPAVSRPMLLFVRAKYLQSTGDSRGMLAASQTALLLLSREDGFTLVDIYFMCLCACANYVIGRTDASRKLLDSVVVLCAENGFVSPLGEYTTWLGGLLEKSLNKSTNEFQAAVLAHIRKTLKNWLFFHNEFARDNASLILTPREYQLAVLLKEGKTYEQAAKQLNLSVGRIRNLISNIYGKLGISKKAEIGRFVY